MHTQPTAEGSSSVRALLTLAVAILALFTTTGGTAVWASEVPRLAVDPAAPGCSDTAGAPYCSIQAAIDAAAPGVIIELAKGRYELWEESVRIDKRLTLSGAGPEATVIDGAGLGPEALVSIGAGAEQVKLQGLALVNRLRSGAAFVGGGAVDHAGGALEMVEVVMRDNQGGYGGALHVHSDSAEVTLDGVVIEGNFAMAGGGLAMRNGPLATLVIRRSTVRGNSAIFSGGGLFLRDVGEVTVTASRIEANRSGTRAGGIFVMVEGVSGSLDVGDSVISGNRSRLGGGIDVEGADFEVRLSKTEVTGNLGDDEPSRADCSASTSGTFISRGGNRLGKGCPPEAAPGAASGSNPGN